MASKEEYLDVESLENRFWNAGHSGADYQLNVCSNVVSPLLSIEPVGRPLCKSTEREAQRIFPSLTRAAARGIYGRTLRVPKSQNYLPTSTHLRD